MLGRRKITRSEHYMRIPDEAKLWFQDFHAIKRVSMASHSLTTFAGRSIWCRSSSGPWHPTHSADGTTAAHVTSAADRPWNCHHSPFRVLRTSHMPSRAGSSLSVPTWQHVYRRVLRELDIEFEPSKTMDTAVSAEPAALMEARGDLHPQQAERG